MNFQIKNRLTGKVQFECELTAEVVGMSYDLQLGFAVRKARESNADLRWANLHGANLSKTDLNGIDLSGVYLRRANLSGANLSGTNLSEADLSEAYLSGANLHKTDLRWADLHGANLSGTDLSGADLSGTNLNGTDLSGANLSKTDLGGADWLPRIPDIHQAVYAAASAPGALNMGLWHTDGYCGTAHCRAGHVVVLAGAGGRVLEGVYGTPAAAALIYQASDPTLERIPDFYCKNEEALADMKRLAEEETTRSKV